MMMFRSTVADVLRVAALVIAFSGFVGAAQAQQPAPPSAGQIQLGRDVVEASGATRAFDGIVPSILQQTLNGVLQQNPDLQKDLVASVQAISPEFEKRRVEIIDIVARIYAQRFTEAELKEILTFYRSATGKKFVVGIPAVLEESFVKTQEWGSKLSEELVVRLRAEMKKKGHTI
jgi:hypothetical protein